MSAAWTPERRRQLSERTKGFSVKRGLPAAGSYVLNDGYRYLTQKQGHPLAKRNGTVAEHRMVLYDAIGPGPHPCHWGCGRYLDWRDPYSTRITADHINSEKLDNRPENLVPACHICNSQRMKAGDPAEWKSGQLNSVCGKGHQYTPENTGLRKGRDRYCRICARAADRARDAKARGVRLNG